MAFWGIEVRPGKPYTHLYDSTRGRLRVSQATVGNGKSMGKSTVQCNVGNKSPILLCSLIPDVSETCHLELEFEEDDEVVFSVIGQRSIHLSGYFVGSGRDTGGDETDSYGEDIAETDTDDSDHYNSLDSEEEYDSDFIDDDDIEMFPPSPQRKSCVVIEEIVEDEKPANGNASRRRLKKKNHVSDFDVRIAESEHQLVVKGNRSTVLESEDEDGFPISFSRRKKAVKNSEETARSDAKTPDEGKKRKIGAISQDPESAKGSCQPSDTSAQPESGDVNVSNEKPKKKKKDKDRKPIETASQSAAEERVSADQNQVLDEKEVYIPNSDEVQIGKTNVDIKEKDLAVDVHGAENDGKPKKKKKERVKKGKTSETSILSADKSEGESKGDPNEALNNVNMDQDLPSNVEPEKSAMDKVVVDHSVPESSGKRKKKNKKKKHTDENAQDRDDTPAVSVGKDAPEVNQQIRVDKVDIDDNEQKKSEDTEKMEDDLLVTQLPNDKCPDINADPEADSVNQHDAKKKSKKKKKSKNTGEDSNTNQGSVDMIAAEGVDEQKDGTQPVKTREFANGLTIEELSMGKPDGKRASPGRTISVHYIGKLKNGEVFDSSTGREPFSFRLGIGEVIKGWDVGVKGMRVGDKRRLTVPPSMGYGDKGAGKIPGKSWLVFDVELVNVK